VIAVTGLARFGLFGVSVGMSVVEGLVSIGGQAVACALIGLTLRDLARSAMPAVRLALLCALATVAGRTVATLAEASGAMMLVAAALPPALVYLWLERSNAMELIGKAFVPGARPKPSQAQA
jgi:EamA domain-containing membrane protein RarD